MLADVLKKHPYLEEITSYLNSEYKEFSVSLYPSSITDTHIILETGSYLWSYPLGDLEAIARKRKCED